MSSSFRLSISSNHSSAVCPSIVNSCPAALCIHAACFHASP
nr:MAG TPA: hypothetical protein [Caudoviricetes sp.]